MRRKLHAESTSTDAADAIRPTPLAVVLRVADGQLQLLLWQRAREPFPARGRCPAATLDPGETLERSIRRHLAAKVDVREVAHLEQLDDAERPRPRARTSGSSRPRTSGSSRPTSTPRCPATPRGIRSTALPPMAFDHGAIALEGRERLRAKLSYTNAGFALAPETFTLSELRDSTSPRSGYAVSATNLQRVLLRRGVLEPTGEHREPGPRGGRPAALFRFRRGGSR